MRLLLSTASLPHYGLARVFEFAHEAGFDGVEVTISKNFDTQNADYIKRVADSAKIPVLALRLGLEISLKNIELAINLAREINVVALIFQPPMFLDFKSKQWIHFDLQKYRGREHFKILFENTADSNLFGILPGRAYNNFQELLELGNFAIDTSNVFVKKASLLKVWGSLKEKVDYITLANYRDGQDHVLPMDGMLPLESFLDRAARYKYDKLISIKAAPKVMDEGKDEKVKRHLKETQEFVNRFFHYEGLEKPEEQEKTVADEIDEKRKKLNAI